MPESNPTNIVEPLEAARRLLAMRKETITLRSAVAMIQYQLDYGESVARALDDICRALCAPDVKTALRKCKLSTG